MIDQNQKDKVKKRANLRAHLMIELELEKMRIIVIGVILLFSGIIAVITQLYLPELMEMSGMELANPLEGSMKGVFLDFWGDMVLIGGIIAVFYGMGSFASETGVNKTIHFLLSRPISRKRYFLSRFILKNTIISTIFIVVSLVVYLYGAIYFEPMNFGSFIMACLLLALMLSGILSVVMMISSKMSSTSTAAIGFGFLVIQIILSLELFTNAFESLKWISPVSISSYWMDLVEGDPISGALLKVITLLLWIIIPGFLGNLFYSKRDL